MPRTPHQGSGRAVAGALTALLTAGLFAAPAAAATPAPATTADQVLFNFTGSKDAGPLTGVIAGPGGVLYGTTAFGGFHGQGSVFSLTPTGSGYTEKVLLAFSGANGAKPFGLAMDARGDLFGNTVIGGAYGAGTVFELVRGASGGYTEQIVHSFTGGTDGSQPDGTPVLDAQGDVFGVTQFGGTGGEGVVYEMKHSATGYTLRVLHAFARNGGLPQAGLTLAGNGALYGTIYGFGQQNPDGTVFRVQPGQTGAVYTPLYNFTGGTDGAFPDAALTVDNGTGVIYGTTEFGGAGNGAVFSLTPHGSGYAEHVLHALAASGSEGFEMEGQLLLTARGDLFGTATSGGIKCSGIGCGTVFEMTPAGGGAFTFRIVHLFTGPPDGAAPQWSGMIPGPGGTLLGTTRSGGSARACGDGGPGGVHGCGTLYKIAA
jgi:uncharacterized repeat protein (TIGR03803 family)